jgi:SAM-dependent methyltransferase
VNDATYDEAMTRTPDTVIRFEDGAAYERYMGVWSQLVGDQFLDWLAPPSDARWLDVGCGNGAFTDRVAQRCAPRSLHGVDPAEGQIRYARSRPMACPAEFELGDAMALPFDAQVFDVAVMPLVIFFVPDPAKGVAEMARVVRPGGLVAAYGWDLMGGGFPYEHVRDALAERGIAVPLPPSPTAAGIDVLRSLWQSAGLLDIETTRIDVRRTFDGFDDYWQTILGGPSVRSQLALMSPADLASLQDRLRQQVVVDATGRVTCQAHANAVKGRVRAGG